MAEIDSIHVKITGDASGLESAVRGAKSSLSSLEQYKNSMQSAQDTLNKSRAVLNNTKKAYEANQKSITQNVEALTKQKTSLERSIAAKNNEIKALEHANTVVNKGSIAYKDNVKAIEWATTELSALEEKHKSVTNSIRTQETVLAGSKKAYEDAQATVKLATKQYDEYEKGLKAVERAEQAQQLQDTGKKWKETSDTINSVTKPLQYTALALAAGGIAAGKFAIDFEDSFAAVKKTVDGTPEQLDEIKQKIIDMTTVGINGHNPIPLTTNELTALAAAGGQLGIATENIADFTETMAMMGTATNLYGEQGAAILARFMNVTNTSQDHVSNLGSAIVELGNNFATTEAEIAQMALNMGATGDVVGISAQDVLAYSTALSSLGVEAQAGGSSVARIWMDIQSAVSSGGKDLQKFAKLSGKSAKEFSEQWKKDASGAFQDFLKGLNESDDQIGVLADLGFNNIRDIQALQRLAGDKGLELLTDAIKRSNDAWEENTALQNEFNSKAETTASQIQVVKNNAVEAARGFGEVMLPTVKDVTSNMAEYARGLADMSDKNKRNLVSVAGGVVTLGLASKGLVAGTKFVGDFAEGIGKIKGTKAFGAVVDTLDMMPTSAKIAAGAVIGLGIAGKKAYDLWYDSQYRWSEGLAEGNKQISESLSKYKDISSIQSEIKDLKFTIENPDSSAEQVETAKSRLEEIKELLSREYNLVINSDNSNLDSAVEAVKGLTESQLKRDINTQTSKMMGLKEKFDRFDPKEYEKLINEQAKYSELINRVEDINTKYKGSDPETLQEKANALNELGEAYGYTAEEIASNSLSLPDLIEQFDRVSKQVDRMSDQSQAYNDYIELSKGLADMNTEWLALKAAAGDSGEVARTLGNIGQYVRNAGLDMNEYAEKTSLAMNGVDKLETAWEQAANGDGTALNGIVKDYIRSMQEFGATASQTATGAALIQNGFRTIKEAADAGALDTIIEQANEFGHSIGEIPSDKHINISASGDISIIDTASGRMEELQRADGTIVRVTATGDVEMLDKAGNQVAYLEGIGAVEIRVNAETGDIEALDEAGNVVANLSKNSEQNVEINVTANSDAAKATIHDLNNEPVEVKANADTSPAKATIQALSQETVTVTVQANVVGMPQATGTQNFPGGLAMVNDQRGISDPRELIIDRGRAFIPQGKDVILPLSKGAKVYTAEQTKAIMRGLGIPRYADGKNNSDAFTSARDDWTHYTRTHAVTSAQELQKWLEFQEKYKENEKDIWDIEEQVFSLRQKQYSEQVRASEQWLAHEEKYNGLSATDYMAGIDRMREYTTKYYEQGILSHKEYTEALISLDENYFNKRSDMLNEQLELSEKYADERTYFNDWDTDNPIEAFRRVQERELSAIGDGRSEKDALKNISDYGSALFQGRISQSNRWLEEQRKYFDISDADYLAGLKRMQDYAQEYLAEGLIGYKEYHEAVTDINHQIWDEQERIYDDALSKQQDYINEMRTKFSEEEQAIRDSWTVADRRADIDELTRKVKLYSGAVTERGQEQLKQYQEQLRQAQREEELYRIQQDNKATIEKLEAEYKIAEDNKKVLLKGVRAEVVDVQAAVNSLMSSVKTDTSSVETLLQRIETAIKTMNTGNTTQYNDNRKVTTVNKTTQYPTGVIALPYLRG